MRIWQRVRYRFDNAIDYVKPGATTFATVCESALRRSEIAIGYRLAGSARDPAAAYGVVVNPGR